MAETLGRVLAIIAMLVLLVGAALFVGAMSRLMYEAFLIGWSVL